MGCKPSKTPTLTEGEPYNSDTNVRKSLLASIEAKRNGDGLEENFQIAFSKKSVKDMKEYRKPENIYFVSQKQGYEILYDVRRNESSTTNRL